MERERRKRRQVIRLIITEIIMVIAIIISVILLTMLAMGYNVNKEGEVDQQGIAQINSHPTGAIVNIDGGDILPHTNTSRLLSAGEHKIRLTRDDYDSWEKVVTVESGVVLKLDYPRLFWQGRAPERVREFKDTELAFFEPAPNHDSIIYAMQGSTEWNLLDIRGDTAVDTPLNVAELLSGLTPERVIWNGDNDKVLVKANNADAKAEWLLLNVKNLKESVNLTKEFKLQFAEMLFITSGGERLLTLDDDGNLRTISVTEKSSSQVLVAEVKDYVMNNSDIMYLTKNNEVKLFRDGDEDILVAKFDENQVVKMSLFEYLSKKYIGLTVGSHLYVYRGDYPNSERTLSDMELVFDGEMSIVPEKLKIEADSELIVAKQGKKVAVFDAELSKLHEFELEGEQMFFIDFYLMGTIADSKLIIRDFDGENRREITAATGTALITKNNKWLYYLNSDGIYREQIID